MKSGFLVWMIFSSFFLSAEEKSAQNWQLGPFERVELANPILLPFSDSVFYCPVQNKEIHWEAEHIFNPGAVVRGGKVYLFYRAEDDYGTGIGNHTSRLGLATSHDGIHFERMGVPVLFPDLDDQNRYEFPGGCEDPRIVETEDWGEGLIHAATSDDLISWESLRDEDEVPIVVLEPRQGKFDSLLVEAGPPAILTKDGILLLYNGKNSVLKGDPLVIPRSYSAGQVLLDPSNPTKVLHRSEKSFFTPERPYEMTGQYKDGTVFVQGLVHFQSQWFLYYGTADSAIGVAVF